MNKVVLLFASLILLCSCDDKLSSDGMAIRQKTVPGTNIPESQVEVKNYTVDEFTRFVDGKRFTRIGVYDLYKKWDDVYYVIMGEEDNGDPILDCRYSLDGTGRDTRQFDGNELMHWSGSCGYEVTNLYNYIFTYASQTITYGSNKEYVAFVNDEYMIIQDKVYRNSSYDAGAMFSRTVYQIVEKKDMYTGRFTDCRDTASNTVLLDAIPQTRIKESLLNSAEYSAARFAEITNGRCYECVAEYIVKKKDGDAYYEIVGRNDRGENVFNMLEDCIGCEREVLMFNDDVLTHMTGPCGYEETGLYKHRFDEASQRLCFGMYRRPVLYVDYDYLVIEYNLYENGESNNASNEDFEYSRMVYKRTDKTNWIYGKLTDYRQ